MNLGEPTLIVVRDMRMDLLNHYEFINRKMFSKRGVCREKHVLSTKRVRDMRMKPINPMRKGTWVREVMGGTGLECQMVNHAPMRILLKP